MSDSDRTLYDVQALRLTAMPKQREESRKEELVLIAGGYEFKLETFPMNSRNAIHRMPFHMLD